MNQDTPATVTRLSEISKGGNDLGANGAASTYRRINLRLTSEMYDALNRKRRSQGASFQWTGVGLLRAWLNGNALPEE